MYKVSGDLSGDVYSKRSLFVNFEFYLQLIATNTNLSHDYLLTDLCKFVSMTTKKPNTSFQSIRIFEYSMRVLADRRSMDE